ncbi:hypothetical protein L249_6642 [Ophiocordyceps polyrhachis-furcata BCC 54312]|uniref:Aromatic prenyltransferase n=1 Tax=Ophiocordyceps polyrhachis-furcata BCC 54312 TaxID=1330021 RepID=A0A367LJY3_9HYPO|nr:hypothetical protein L249_6642 [Ophiocordyceps polyrhachis-furcata BCC 54312]
MDAPPTQCQPWQALAQQRGYANEDEQYWGSKISPLVGSIMKWARYSTAEQHRVLTFLFTYIIPSCGPKPDDRGELSWKTCMNYDYTPVQLSLNFHDEKMTLRSTNIPIGHASGTADDPINQQAALDAIARQQRALPSNNTDWINHFVSKLFLEPDAAAALKAKASEFQIHCGPQCILSHDFPDGNVQCKVTFAPFWKAFATGFEIKSVLWDAILGLGQDAVPYKPALDVLGRYLASESAKAAGASPYFFCFDAVPEGSRKSSRIKIYFCTSRTALDAMVDIYTLGGFLSGPEMVQSLEALRILWKAIVKVPDHWPDDRDLPPSPSSTAAVIFNFEIQPGTELPAPKIYLPAHYYGRSELEMADGMDYFFQSQGLDTVYPPYKENFIKCFMNEEKQFTAVHHDIAFSMKPSGPYVTTYYKPELHAGDPMGG